MANSNLLSKLKFRPEYQLLLINAPEDYLENMDGIAYKTEISQVSGQLDMLHIFAYNKVDVDRFVPDAAKLLKYDGLLWMSYAKGTSKIKTDINRDKGWDTLRSLGFEGIALIAIDETWAAMRFRPKEKIKSTKTA
jgi:hypothetical protein